MIVPRYWAESRCKHRDSGRQVTIRRFGWSNVSMTDAQTMADERARGAMARELAGERQNRFEPKVPYNGAEGVPIREEIVEHRSETIITRNSYGARCLNTPNVFFSDLDSVRPPNPRAAVQMGIFLLCGLISVFLLFHSPILALGELFLTFALIWIVSTFWKAQPASENPWEENAIASVRAYVDQNPGWNARLYRTPAGLRVMVTHRPFLPDEPEVKKFFHELNVDPVYQLMCFRQNCFRARVSPKPWRIGIGDHIRPRPGTWPVTPERQPQRNAWIQQYESAATGFAACQFIESIGNGYVAQEILPVVSWHDELCKAQSGLPIA